MLKKIIEKVLPNSIKRKINDYLVKKFSVLPVTRPYVIELLEVGRFKQKVAIVTGGSGAIGRAVCCRLASEGAIVYVCGMTESKILQVVDEIKNFGGIAYACTLNVMDEEHISRIFDKIIEKHGNIDILINSAGGSTREKCNTLAEQEVKEIDQILNVNLRGAMLCSRKAAKQMINQKSGKIINITSVIGSHGKASFAEYAASKAGSIGFVKSLAMELGRYGVNVNCVSPGIVQRGSIQSNQLERLRQTNYMSSYGKPEDISSMVAFLVSDEASFITGQDFIVDGGRSLGLKGD
jgi:3-oxoacyl-[acyl-carrier protein] reductase